VIYPIVAVVIAIYCTGTRPGEDRRLEHQQGESAEQTGNLALISQIGFQPCGLESEQQEPNSKSTLVLLLPIQ
jgi:hypothetical protein